MFQSRKSISLLRVFGIVQQHNGHSCLRMLSRILMAIMATALAVNLGYEGTWFQRKTCLNQSPNPKWFTQAR